MKTACIIITICIILFALLFLAIDWMTRYAYDRKSPSLPKPLIRIIMGKNPRKSKNTSIKKEEALALEKKANKKIEISSFDNAKMVGHYYPAENPKRFVIACHGWRSGWSFDYRSIAPFLHDNNTSVLMIELRAHGESEGRYLYYGKKERFDIACWSDYVAKELCPNVPIYIMGMSVGGMCSLMSSDAGLNSNTIGIIADSASGSARDFANSVIRNMKLNPKIVYPFIRLDSKIRLGMDDNDYTAFDSMKNNKLPILFIHGTKDKVAQISSMEKVYALCQAPKFKLIIDNATHMNCCFVEPEKYQKALVDFFNFCEKNSD